MLIPDVYKINVCFVYNVKILQMQLSNYLTDKLPHAIKWEVYLQHINIYSTTAFLLLRNNIFSNITNYQKIPLCGY